LSTNRNKECTTTEQQKTSVAAAAAARRPNNALGAAGATKGLKILGSKIGHAKG